jgi:ribose-phosphate pyrophosphokinase
MRFIITVFLVLFFITFPGTCFGEASPLVVGIRGNEAATSEFAKKNTFSLAEENTVEFGNGNTFVRFKSPVKNRDMVVLLPDELDPNTLMETLLKLHTGKTSGGRSLLVASKKPLSEIALKGLPPLNLERLVVTAGATHFALNGENTKPLSYKRAKPTQLEPEASAVIVGNSHPELAKETADLTGLFSVNQVDSPALAKGGKQIYLIAGHRTPFNQGFFERLHEIDTLNSKGNEVFFITPYLPYARSDKKDQAGVTIGGKLAADLIRGQGASGASFLRAHAPQSQGFFEIPTDAMTGLPTAVPYLKNAGVQIVISPDEGFQKSATEYALAIGVPVGVINQRRDPITAKKELHGYSGEPVNGKTVVIIDDESETGGTSSQAAKLMKTYGASKVLVVLSHITGSAKKALESPYIDEFVATNTMADLPKSDRLKILSIAPELSHSIQDLEEGRKSRLKSCWVARKLAF